MDDKDLAQLARSSVIPSDTNMLHPTKSYLVGVSDIFYLFLLGGGEGGVWGARKGGGLLFIENPRTGGFRGERERAFVGNVGGGRQFFFVSGPKFPPSLMKK